MSNAREAHTATLLPDGKVLVAGGYGDTNDLASAELYDPTTGKWTLTGDLDGRQGYTATLLPNGRVLVAGGNTDGNTVSIASAQLYDQASGTWTTTGALNFPRSYHTATLLPNGKVLVAGGEFDTAANPFELVAPAELYDPVTGLWTLTGAMNVLRSGHTATLLANGKVLVVSGDPVPVAPCLAGWVFGGTAEVYDPSTGAWTITGGLNVPRDGFSATLLPNGQVLVAGGETVDCNAFSMVSLSITELFDPATGTWTPTGQLNTERVSHAATLLPNGRVLVVGGQGSGVTNGLGIFERPLSSAEEYDPATGEWVSTGSMAVDRYQGTATMLANGLVLVAGGVNFQTKLSSAELFNPSEGGTWMSAGLLATGRVDHTATLLTNGQVLVAGGQILIDPFNNGPAELYDPTSGLWTPTDDMHLSRFFHTATLLPDGQVLAVGGLAYNGTGNVPVASAELYDPATGNWRETSLPNQARAFHTATLVANGKVLIAAGAGPNSLSQLASAEVYDPVTKIWSITGSLNIPRRAHRANLLPDGQVLVTGGVHSVASSVLPIAEAELYDSASGTWKLTGSLGTGRFGHTATLLPNGKVLVAGGEVSSTNALSSAELYDPGTGTWTATGSMGSRRSEHTATLLPNGLVLVAGGRNSSFSSTDGLSSAELYDPVAGVWAPAAQLASGRNRHTATLLGEGGVLVTGGFGPEPMWTASMDRAELYDLSASVGPVPQPGILTSAQILASGSFQFAFTNTPGAHFSVLATPFPTLPTSEWMVLGGVSETSPGYFVFTDSQATNFLGRFYRLRSP
jgi:large repetitive protein